MTQTFRQRAFAPELVSLAAAHGITRRLAQTWHPTLLRTPRVLVPIELDVLLVRDPQAQAWADCLMTPPPAADHGTATPPTPAASLMAAPFAERTTPRPRGAYLQWYLPNGLTSGTSDGTAQQATFPAIPDRYLVVRISQGRVPWQRATRGWILQAGGEPGLAFDLAGWTEPGAATGMQNPLTALGHGDTSWAGYFDNVLNRLSFYDGTLDTDGVLGPLAYVVCGWYEDPTLDPLGDQEITSLAAFDAAMAQLGWSLDTGQLAEVTANRNALLSVTGMIGLLTARDARLDATGDATAAYTTDGSWWPTATLYHGSVVGIDWPGDNDTAELGGPPDPTAVRVAIGNTMAEAMGALVSLANAAPQEAAIVEALQLGVIKEFDQADGRAELDARLHASSFASWSGGSNDANTEPFRIAPSGPPVAPPANPPAPGGGVFTQSNSGVAPPPNNLHEIFATRPADDIQLVVERGATGVVHAEEHFITGHLVDVVANLGLGAQMPPSDPGGTIDALRAAPRLYTPKDPVVLVQGGKRAFSHDSSVATEDGKVVCRLTPVTELSYQMPQSGSRFAVRSPDILEGALANGSIPPECDGIVGETMLLDPGSASAVANFTARADGTPAEFDLATAQRNVTVEQTAWYAVRNPRIDHGPLLAQSGLAGTLPAAFSIAPASRPWTPMHLDWQVEYVASPGGIEDWSPNEIDFVPGPRATVPQAGSGIMLSARAPLTGGASSVLSSAISDTLRQIAAIGGTGPVPTGAERFYSETSQRLIGTFQGLTLAKASTISSASETTAPGASATDASATQGNAAPADSAVDPSLLQDIASALAAMDVLSCGLNGVLTQLRGGVPGDGTSTSPTGAVPAPFFAFRAGFLRIVRLRLVDGFGQFVDLCGSDATHAAQGYVVSGAMAVDDEPGIVALPPRFTSPTRAWFRFMSAEQPGVEADYETTPVCAFVLPNHLDGSLEFFGADGRGAGSLQPMGDGRVMWQNAPGTPAATGQNPASALTNTYAAQFAQSLIDWGIADAGQDREPALLALLRTIDSTMWAVDPFGHAGDEHLSLLLGHPVCVMRALVRLDVVDPIVTADATVTAVPIRLGDLTQWQDGLLGYFVNDDYSVLHVADSAAPAMARAFGPGAGFLQQINLVPSFYASFADDLTGGATGDTPVTHPYVDTSGVMLIRPNQTIALTLLVSPLTTVHATLGLVPRKEIGMRREWVQAGLAAIAPTFRFGPVLVDPQHIRMPLATDLNGSWVWDYRADASRWTEDPTTNATDNALLGADPPTALEGWLRLTPPPAKA